MPGTPAKISMRRQHASIWTNQRVFFLSIILVSSSSFLGLLMSQKFEVKVHMKLKDFLAPSNRRHDRFGDNCDVPGGFQFKVRVKDSPIHGRGIFVDEFIPKGALVWRFDPDQGVAFGKTEKVCNQVLKDLKLSEQDINFVLMHAYGHGSTEPEVRLANDMSDFMNHDSQPNLVVHADPDVDESFAARDIFPGEELLEDYCRYDKVAEWQGRCLGTLAVESYQANGEGKRHSGGMQGNNNNTGGAVAAVAGHSEAQDPADLAVLLPQLPAGAPALCAELLDQFSREGSTTWREHCAKRVLGNHSFGMAYAPLVDKEQVKKWVAAKRIPGLHFAKTFAVFSPEHFGVHMKWGWDDLPDRFVVKPSHYWGAILQVEAKENKARCLKKCKRKLGFNPSHLDQDGHFTVEPDVGRGPHLPSNSLAAYVRKQQTDPGRWQLESRLRGYMKYYLSQRFTKDSQPQYEYIPPQILFEEYLPITLMSGGVEFRAWTVHGVVHLVEIMCPSTSVERGDSYSYVSTDFEELDVSDHDCDLAPCDPKPTRPPNWEQFLEIVGLLSKDIPELVRVDFYMNDTHVYFSEFTFTPDGCQKGGDPKSAEQLLYWALSKPERAREVTADVVECVIGTQAHPTQPAFKKPKCEVGADENDDDDDDGDTELYEKFEEFERWRTLRKKRTKGGQGKWETVEREGSHYHTQESHYHYHSEEERFVKRLASPKPHRKTSV